MKIALLTFYNKAIAEYDGVITSKINELYCINRP